ncbi:MAG: OmpA family protein [Rhodopirellula sp.]|nr:OmpA family protein [Rhodopirellula sp.]
MEFEEDAPPGVPEWVVTYGDMMSLLLTFFIMLVSMSELKDEGKNRAALNSMREAFGPMDGTSGVPGRTFNNRSSNEFMSSKSSKKQTALEKGSIDSIGGGGPESSVATVNHGEIVTVGGSLEFDQFATDLGDDSLSDLNRIIEAVKRVPNRIIVRGHSFAEPVRNKPQFRDQHDLSFARARSVAKYLMENDINSDRILVSAAGDAEPRIVTRNLEDRRHNRRVDVFTIDSFLAPPDPG